MRQLFYGLACMALLLAPAGHDRVVPIIVRTPTAEEIAIYRIVLQSFLEKSKQPLNLVDRVFALDAVPLVPDTDGIKGSDMRSRKIRNVLHLDAAVTQGMPVTLVDSDHFNRPAREDAPGIIPQKATHIHHRLTDTRKKTARPTLPSALLSLSTIVFDPTHKTAVVAYRFVCGALCGDGGMFVLQRSSSSWEILHKNIEWVS